MRTRRGGLARGDASWSARARRPRRRLNTRDFSGEDAHLVWGPPTPRGTPRRAARAPGKREEIERVSLKTPWRLCRDRSRGKSRRGRRARGRFTARRERGKSRLSHAPDDGRQRSHFVREHLNDGGRRERVCAMCARRDESDIPRASDVTRRISVSRTPRRVRARRRSVVPARAMRFKLIPLCYFKTYTRASASARLRWKFKVPTVGSCRSRLRAPR